MITDKHLILKKNTALFTTPEAIKLRLKGIISSFKDGEIIIGRYGTEKDQKTLLAIKQIDESFQYIDITNIENLLNIETALRKTIEGQNSNVYVPSDDEYIKAATDMTNADELLSKAITKLKQDIKDKNYVTNITFEGITDSYGKFAPEDANKYTIVHNDMDTVSKTDFTVKYNNLSPTALTVPVSIGDIKQGMTCAELAGKSVSEILDMIIFKTLYPSIPNPSASISFANGFTNGALYEIGSVGPSDSNMNSVLNKGNIAISELTAEQDSNRNPIQRYTVGDATETTYTYSNGGSGNLIVKGNNTILATIKYAKGDQPLDSKGKSYLTPHEAGSVNSSTIKIIGVYPWFIANGVTTDGKAITVTKQPLYGDGIGSNVIIANLPSNGSDLASKVGISLPLNKATQIMKYNSVSGKYDINALTDFTQTSNVRQVQGKDVVYYDIMCNLGAVGAAQYQITYNE